MLIVVGLSSVASGDARERYRKFEDVPPAAYQAELSAHFGHIESVTLLRDITIGSIPCAAGQLELYFHSIDDRCEETEEQRGVPACHRAHERDMAAYRKREGVRTRGYSIESCTLASDARLGGVRLGAGATVRFYPGGDLQQASTAAHQRLHGIDVADGAFVELYRGGGLRQVTLATDQAIRKLKLRGGTELELARDGRPIRYTTVAGNEVRLPGAAPNRVD